MGRKIRYWIMAAAVIGVMAWSAVQIYSKIKPQQILVQSEYHWDILAYEVLLIIGSYALLILWGKGKSVNGTRKMGRWTHAE
ncbi:hypothetical protein RZO55_06795 [Clostridium boliviensis]|uniref:CPBP family intramembrane metalloprotease n=1 Tax=Clostridium boliviensis TaxID=318465 RepID=A0ABU4GI47_9CLOT|nr:hypothetical protein [Clostridium boliviensis]MDW2797282.1 hypothetical protein [Clostridium boliviensis]